MKGLVQLKLDDYIFFLFFFLIFELIALNSLFAWVIRIRFCDGLLCMFMFRLTPLPAGNKNIKWDSLKWNNDVGAKKEGGNRKECNDFGKIGMMKGIYIYPRLILWKLLSTSPFPQILNNSQSLPPAPPTCDLLFDWIHFFVPNFYCIPHPAIATSFVCWLWQPGDYQFSLLRISRQLSSFLWLQFHPSPDDHFLLSLNTLMFTTGGRIRNWTDFRFSFLLHAFRFVLLLFFNDGQ